jgi:hypothetical protein
MGRVPTSQEFARLYRHMDLASRARLSREVRAGKVSDDVDEAALLSAMAHRELRATRWSIGLAAALAGLNVVSAATTDFSIPWLDLAVAAGALVAIIVLFVRAGPLRVTERLNRERVERGA